MFDVRFLVRRVHRLEQWQCGRGTGTNPLFHWHALLFVHYRPQIKFAKVMLSQGAQGVSGRPSPHCTVKSKRYASYWNAFLFSCCFQQKRSQTIDWCLWGWCSLHLGNPGSTTASAQNVQKPRRWTFPSKWFTFFNLSWDGAGELHNR